jgi:hypothetical protein
MAGRGLAALSRPVAAAPGRAATDVRPACDAWAGRPDSVASATANVAADQVATRIPEARLVVRTAVLLSAATAPRSAHSRPVGPPLLHVGAVALRGSLTRAQKTARVSAALPTGRISLYSFQTT